MVYKWECTSAKIGSHEDFCGTFKMTQTYIQTVLQLLTLLILGVSTQKVTSSPATNYILKGWVPNACTLVVCAPYERSPEKENGDQGFQGPVQASSNRGPERDGESKSAEFEYFRKEIRYIQTQLNAYKVEVNKALQVLLKPHGVMVGDKIFKTDGSTGDYETAKTICLQMGATIASPRNAAENQAVRQIVQWQNRNALLGINDIETEGRFVHTNGEILGYSNWASGEPNNVGNEDCIEMHPDGKWHDRYCKLPMLVICEF